MHVMVINLEIRKGNTIFEVVKGQGKDNHIGEAYSDIRGRDEAHKNHKERMVIRMKFNPENHRRHYCRFEQRNSRT